MSMLVICLAAGLMLSLPGWSHQACSDGSVSECKDAEFVPGSNLAGEGFDITKMERKGAFVIDMNSWKRKDKTCTLCQNPYMEGKKQKIPLSVVDWRPSQKCSMKISSQLHRSSESLVGSSSSSVNNNWKVNLDVNAPDKSGKLMMAGTKSRLAEYSMEKTKSDKFIFTSQSVSCVYYSYRVSSRPKLHREFRREVNRLPKTYSPESKPSYDKLIDSFGTHYITKVKLGGAVQSVTSIRQCQARLQGLSAEEVQTCLEVEASATVGSSVSLETEAKRCQEDKAKTESRGSFSSSFSDRFTEIKGGHTTEPELLFSADKDPSSYKAWLTSVPRLPDVVSYSLEPFQELLPATSPARKNLRQAISHYILERALWRNCSEPCLAGVKSGGSSDPCVCSCHNEAAVGEDCCPTRRGAARVILTVLRAQSLWGDHTTKTDGYVKVFVDGMEPRRTRVVYNDDNPYWDEVFTLATVDLSGGKKVRFEVWDEDDKWNDDLLGGCERALTSGVGADLCFLQNGKMFYQWEVTCAPSLGGPTCDSYKPTPMNRSLEKKAYVSRHAHPLPRDMLLEMGVFVDTPKRHDNQSLTAGSGDFC